VENCGSKRRGGARERREAVQKVARDCGFGDPERMRRAFLRILGRPPSALRPG
jgi:transcriptional regulator GlxA family with amidase domain